MQITIENLGDEFPHLNDLPFRTKMMVGFLNSVEGKFYRGYDRKGAPIFGDTPLLFNTGNVHNIVLHHRHLLDCKVIYFVCGEFLGTFPLVVEERRLGAAEVK